ncbi:MAG: FliM/FliN family flagellar motor switch protein [Acidobacteriia bacterium]|nr:FliM/FliN family flagellar motor switch protein [Terriglobia bacterium]
MIPLEEIGVLADIAMEVEVELDRKIMAVRDILALENGSVIAMQRSAGETIDILIGGAVIGSGEIVILDDKVAVRITDFKEDE